jgi:hypothetical protein
MIGEAPASVEGGHPSQILHTLDEESEGIFYPAIDDEE